MPPRHWIIPPLPGFARPEEGTQPEVNGFYEGRSAEDCDAFLVHFNTPLRSVKSQRCSNLRVAQACAIFDCESDVDASQAGEVRVVGQMEIIQLCHGCHVEKVFHMDMLPLLLLLP